MITLKKSQKLINVTIEDKLIRLIETNGDNIYSVRFFEQRTIPSGLILHGRILDEIGFFEYMKELVKELKIKNRYIQFNVPNSLVIMRQVEVPSHLSERKEIVEYIKDELGKSIHLPFEEPIIDVPLIKSENTLENEVQQITIFAAPGEELRKYTEVFADASLRPQAADVGILSNYRYFHHTNSVFENHIYLLFELNAASTHLGIFHNDQIEFLRYQDLDLEVKNKFDEEKNEIVWNYDQDETYVRGIMIDQVSELERIMNFYRFSLHRGDKSVTDIVLLGDNPYLEKVFEEMKNRYEDINVILLDHHTVEKNNDTIDRAFVPALGLALRGGK